MEQPGSELSKLREFHRPRPIRGGEIPLCFDGDEVLVCK
jgi:hypothetical protein